MVGVIRAVHHAHQRGVLHRDLKPSNVLVDSQGTRMVTDFGLAKRLSSGDRSFTETGQVLGTPKYMAPEQAAGRKDLTVAADVYSLGVILYERLTGQTPFTGDNALDALAPGPRVGAAAAVVDPAGARSRPGNRGAEVPGEGTGPALSVGRGPWPTTWPAGSGRPIAARPVGQAERFWRWCRRNPAVAGLTAAVALALVLGAVVSGYFALAERRGRIRAEQAEQEANAANDRTERTFAQSLARPLDPNGDDENHRVLSEPETVALWELSLNQDKPIGLRFLDEAMRDPIAVRQLRARAEPALIAAVGLDTRRREWASRRLRERLRDQGRPLSSKAEVGFVALELEDQFSPAPEDHAGIIIQALTEDYPEDLWISWREHLIEGSNRFDPRIASHLLVAMMEREAYANSRSELASALTTVASRLERAEATRICGKAAQILASALALATDVSTCKSLFVALSQVSERLEHAEAAQMLTTILAQQKDDFFREPVMHDNYFHRLVNRLPTATARIDPAEAARVCAQASQILARALMRETDDKARLALESELEIVLARLQPTQSARVWSELAQSLVATLVRETDVRARHTLAHALTSVSSRLEPAEAARICGQAARSLANALEREKDATVCGFLGDSFESVTSRMEPAPAARICGEVARLLIPFLERMRSTDSFGHYSPGLEWVSFVSSRMDPAEAASLLLAAVERSENGQVRHAFVTSLASAAGRLDAAEDARICHQAARVLIAALGTQTNVYSSLLAEDVVAVVARFDKTEAALICGQAAQVLATALTNQTDTNARSVLAGCLAMVSSRLAPAEAARICSPAARVLADALERELNASARYSLANGLVWLAGSMNPFEDSRSLVAAVMREDDNKVRDQLVSLAGRSDLAEAARIYGQAAQILETALVHEKDASERFGLASRLVELS